MNIPRLIRTLRFLKARQIWARVYLHVRRRPIRAATPHVKRERAGDFARPIQKQQTMLEFGKFHILNQDIEIDDPSRWNDQSRDKLLLYHLHYMDDLNSVAADQSSEWFEDLIERWIDDNPTPAGNGWEPYPLSLRIVNWIKWVLAGNSLSERALQSLRLQTKVLNQSIEFHLLANHIFANAKALFFAGTFFCDGEANKWLRKGMKLLQTEIQEQVLADGGHFERSPMYHAIILGDILDIVNISRAFGVDEPRKLAASVVSMLRWLSCMTHPDGRLAYFNDTTSGVAPLTTELEEYAARLGFITKSAMPAGVTQLAASGYVRYRHNEIVIIVDVGDIGPDYQPGHAHCDCLSFELSRGSRQYLVNSGISTYNANERRLLERATASHNTVSIDGVEQSEIWSAFRVGRRARPVDVEVDDRRIMAAHDGYRHRGIIHRRSFEFFDDRLEIRDDLESDSAVSGFAHFHCCANIRPVIDGNNVDIGGLRLIVEKASKIDVVDYEYCSGFNNRVPAKKIVVSFVLSLKTSIYYANTLH